MVNKTIITVVCIALLVLQAGCGGGGSSQPALNANNQVGLNQIVSPGENYAPASPVVRLSDWEMGELPGTIPPEPKDVAAVIARFAENVQAANLEDKSTSATLSTIAAGSATVPPVSEFLHAFVQSDDDTFREGQADAEYHISGTVTDLELEAGGVSYATIGLVTFFTYDFALNNAPDAPQSQYMFNQNVYLMIRRDGDGDYWVRLADYNSRWGSVERYVTMPFDFDLKVEPTNPIVSTPGVPPYTTHDVGLATLSIDDIVVGTSVVYGDDSWGWYRSAGPELFDIDNGGVMLMGQVYASGTTVTSLLEFNATFESVPIAPELVAIDCTAFPRARFFLHLPDDTIFSGPHDTDVVYDASGDLAEGDQFYVSFDVDSAASPNDLFLYPKVPATGLVTVNAASLTIAAAITPYYTNPAGTRWLVLNAGTYNRVTNNLTSLGHALYNLRDTGTGSIISVALDTDSSGTDQVILRNGITYRPLFSAEAYPTAGSDPASNGSAETIYPTEWITGDLLVDGDILGGGAAAQVVEQGTVLGDYFTQAGLVNTLDSDAYCRFEADASLTSFRYGYIERPSGSWIVPVIPGLDNNAKPFNTAAFARGTIFQVSNTESGSTVDISVDAGQLLDGVTSITHSFTPPGSGEITLNVLPVRVWDDPAASDPDANITVTGTGWDVVINFLLQYGNAPYTVELDTDYGAAWDDGTAGRVHTLSGSPFTSPGLLNGTVSILSANQPLGSYTFAIRVTDSTPDPDTYVWPNNVALGTTGWTIASPNPDSADDVGLHTSMTLIGGYPAIAYYDFTNGDLMYVRAIDSSGSQWESPVIVDQTGDVGRYCSLKEVGPVGDLRPAISYYDGTDGELWFARSADNAGTDWSGVGSQRIRVDFDRVPNIENKGVGTFTSLYVISGNPAISYRDDTNHSLKYARAEDPSGIEWTLAGDAIQVTAFAASVEDGIAGFDTSLTEVEGEPAIAHGVYGPAGQPDQSFGDLWYVRAADGSLGAVWAGAGSVRVKVFTRNSDDRKVYYPSLEVVSGYPAISYYLLRDARLSTDIYGVLKYVRATEVNGAIWGTAQTIDGVGVNSVDRTGLYNSLEIINGNPAVSFYNAKSGLLKYRRAADLTGTAWDAIQTPDSVGVVGGYTSLLEVGGQPAISYYDFTNGNLKYVRYNP